MTESKAVFALMKHLAKDMKVEVVIPTIQRDNFLFKERVAMADMAESPTGRSSSAVWSPNLYFGMPRAGKSTIGFQIAKARVAEQPAIVFDIESTGWLAALEISLHRRECRLAAGDAEECTICDQTVAFSAWLERHHVLNPDPSALWR